MHRFKSTSSKRNSGQAQSPPTSYTQPMANGHDSAVISGSGRDSMGGMSANDSRPVSVSTTQSYDVLSRPNQTQSIPPNMLSSSSSTLSRTDLIVLKHFWDMKAQENKSRDIHFLKFPKFPPSPETQHLLPFLEIYKLISTQPSAKIMHLGTGSTDGVCIGFELFEGGQLHIDMDDDWRQVIKHYHVGYKPFDRMMNDVNTESAVRSWHKPLTIEYLEEMWTSTWEKDLMSICWEATERGELGGRGAATSATA